LTKPWFLFEANKDRARPPARDCGLLLARARTSDIADTAILGEHDIRRVAGAAALPFENSDVLACLGVGRQQPERLSICGQ